MRSPSSLWLTHQKGLVGSWRGYSLSPTTWVDHRHHKLQKNMCGSSVQNKPFTDRFPGGPNKWRVIKTGSSFPGIGWRFPFNPRNVHRKSERHHGGAIPILTSFTTLGTHYSFSPIANPLSEIAALPTFAARRHQRESGPGGFKRLPFGQPTLIGGTDIGLLQLCCKVVDWWPW